MKHLIITTFVVALCCTTGLVAADPTGPQDAMAILLSNGHVLHGAIADEGDQVLIKLGPGSQVRLPRVQVVASANTLDELFRIQRGRLRRDDIAKQVELARWCGRHDLTRQAGEVLVDLTAIAPDDPQVIALEQQLRRALAGQATPVATERSVAPTDLVENPPLAQPRNVPPEALAQFTQQIQPLLNNHCGASGCHGVAGKSDFALLRPLPSGRWTQRMTQRNLQAAAAHVNFTSAAESRLLLAATQPHGGLDSPIFRSPQDARSSHALDQWLQALGAANAPKRLVADEDPPRNLGDEQPTISPPAESPTSDSPFPLARPRDRSAAFEPRDPFDAEIFNRRFFPERFAEETSP